MPKHHLHALAVAVAVAVTLPLHATANEKRIDSTTAFGCQSKQEYRRLTQFAIDGDDAAFVKGMQGAIAARRCMVFRNQHAVFLEEFELTTGLAKVRPKGTTVSFWTSNNAIK